MILLSLLMSACNKEQINFFLKKTSITSVSIQSGRIIARGRNLHMVSKISPISANLSGYTMTIENKSQNILMIKLKHASNNTLALAIGTVLSFTVTTVSAETTVNLTVDTSPSGAVLAFNLAACPAGWSDFTPAEGRFIAGIDPADVTQTVGDLSAGELPTITSTLDLFSATQGESNAPAGSPKLGPGSIGQGSAVIFVNSQTSSVGSVASGNARPAHVILKYCEKD